MVKKPKNLKQKNPKNKKQKRKNKKQNCGVLLADNKFDLDS